MQVCRGLEMLEISAEMMGRVEVIHPTLFWDNDTVILVDTGYPGQLPLFRDAFHNANVPFQSLDKIIVTHQDLDHIGGLPAILAESSFKIEVLANEIEKTYIQGEKRLLKITPETISQAMDSLPTGVPEQWRKAFKSVLENPPKAKVDTTVADGQILPHCGGIIVINTPGHTPGHISLYHKPSKTLIAADAMTIVDGRLMGPDPEQTLDINLANESLKTLTQYDIQTVICYHGGLYDRNANQRILELASL